MALRSTRCRPRLSGEVPLAGVGVYIIDLFASRAARDLATIEWMSFSQISSLVSWFYLLTIQFVAATGSLDETVVNVSALPSNN